MVRQIKYLGVYLDDKMSWEIHIEKLRKQLRCLSFNFYFIREYVPFEVLLVIYKALVLSIINYGISVYGQASSHRIQRLQRTHNLILKHLSFSQQKARINNAIGEDWIQMSIKQLFVMRIILNNHLDSRNWEKVDHDYGTRAHNYGNFKLERSYNKYGERRKTVCVRKVFNMLPEEILNLTKMSTFKKRIKEWIMQNISYQ